MEDDMAQQDHLGRELDDTTKGPQTVTQFAVQEGNVDADTPGVQETVKAEKAAATAGTKRAERVSAAMAPAPASSSTDDAGEDPDRS